MTDTEDTDGVSANLLVITLAGCAVVDLLHSLYCFLYKPFWLSLLTHLPLAGILFVIAFWLRTGTQHRELDHPTTFCAACFAIVLGHVLWLFALSPILSASRSHPVADYAVLVLHFVHLCAESTPGYRFRVIACAGLLHLGPWCWTSGGGYTWRWWCTLSSGILWWVCWSYKWSTRPVAEPRAEPELERRPKHPSGFRREGAAPADAQPARGRAEPGPEAGGEPTAAAAEDREQAALKAAFEAGWKARAEAEQLWRRNEAAAPGNPPDPQGPRGGVAQKRKKKRK